MLKLSDGERIVRCLSGEPVDRVPLGAGGGWGSKVGRKNSK